jgi:hypothetical protein
MRCLCALIYAGARHAGLLSARSWRSPQAAAEVRAGLHAVEYMKNEAIQIANADVDRLLPASDPAPARFVKGVASCRPIAYLVAPMEGLVARRCAQSRAVRIAADAAAVGDQHVAIYRRSTALCRVLAFPEAVLDVARSRSSLMMDKDPLIQQT